MNLGSGVHVLLEHSNRGKKSLGLDLSKPEGLDILYQLAARCDVFLTNKMPGVRSRLHIDVDDIRAHNPNIVYVRGSGYGAARSRGRSRRLRPDLVLVPRRQRDGREAPGVGPHPDPACARVRRLARRDDDRGRHRRRALPPRADGRGDRRRRVAPRRRHVGDGRRDRAVAAARHAVASDAGRPGRDPQPARRCLPHEGRRLGRVLDVAGLRVLARDLHRHRPARADRRPALQLARGAGRERPHRGRDRRGRDPQRDARRVEAAAREHPRAVVAGAGLAERRRRPAGAGQRLRARDPDEGRRAVQAGDGAGPVRRGAVPALAPRPSSTSTATRSSPRSSVSTGTPSST